MTAFGGPLGAVDRSTVGRMIEAAIEEERQRARREIRQAITPFVFANGWRPYVGGSPDPFGSDVGWVRVGNIVYLCGLIDKNGGNYIANETMIVLPSEACPRGNVARLLSPRLAGGAGSSNGRIDVQGDAYPSGSGPSAIAMIEGASANPVNWVSLNGMSYVL